MSKKIGLFCSLAILLILPTRHLAAAQSEPALTGSWVGVYELAERGNIFFIEWDEVGEGHYYTRQSPRPGTIRDLHQEEQQIQFSAGRGDNRLAFSGTWLENAYVGQITGKNGQGRFYLAPLIEVTTSSFDSHIGGYETDRGQAMLVSRADPVDQLFYQEGARQIRMYPTGENRFLTTLGEQLSFEQDHLQLSAALHPELSYIKTAVSTDNYQEELVTFRNGNVTLSGSLLLPSGDGPCPAVILLHGAGAAERHFYRIFADQFARHGIVALIYDKRGHGASTGQGAEATLQDLADDARTGIQLLVQHEKINPARIGIWGFSQGGRVLPMVAAQDDDIAFAVAVSAPGMSAATLDLWRQDITGQGERKTDLVRSYELMLSWLKQSLAAWQEPDGDQALDPTTFWQKVTQPVLLIYGSEDSVVPPIDSLELILSALDQGGNEDVTFRVFPDANHDIMLVGTSVPTFAPDYFETLIAWIDNEDIAQSDRSSIQSSGEFDENGRYAPSPWHGQFWSQLLLVLFVGIVFLFTVVALMIRRSSRENGSSSA